jgi:hypothetical protein
MEPGTELRDVWFAPEDSVSPALARKHRIADHVRTVVERLVGLDCDTIGPEALDDVEAAALQLADLLRTAPDLRRHGPLANAPAPHGALVERSPVSGRGNALAPPLRYDFNGPITRAWTEFSAAYEGPAGSVHGGCVAAVFDEVLGVAQMAAGAVGFTGTLSVRYLRRTPLRQRVDYEAGVTARRGRKLQMWARSNVAGVVVAEAEGLFIAQVDLENWRDPDEIRG